MSERWKPNVTVAAIIEQDGRYLLVEEETEAGLLLNNPAGHLEPGESPIDACVRETLEETTHHFEPTALVGIYLARQRKTAGARLDAVDADLTWLRFAFSGTLGAAQAGRALDSGIVRTLWLTLPEIRACQGRHRSPLLLQCVQDHAAGHRHPLGLLHVDPSLYRDSE